MVPLPMKPIDRLFDFIGRARKAYREMGIRPVDSEGNEGVIVPMQMIKDAVKGLCGSCAHFRRKVAYDHPADDYGPCAIRKTERGGRLWVRADDGCEKWLERIDL